MSGAINHLPFVSPLGPDFGSEIPRANPRILHDPFVLRRPQSRIYRQWKRRYARAHFNRSKVEESQYFPFVKSRQILFEEKYSLVYAEQNFFSEMRDSFIVLVMAFNVSSDINCFEKIPRSQGVHVAREA